MSGLNDIQRAAQRLLQEKSQQTAPEAWCQLCAEDVPSLTKCVIDSEMTLWLCDSCLETIKDDDLLCLLQLLRAGANRLQDLMNRIKEEDCDSSN